jgi:hypothetical protein
VCQCRLPDDCRFHNTVLQYDCTMKNFLQYCTYTYGLQIDLWKGLRRPVWMTTPAEIFFRPPAVPAVLQTAGLLILSRNVRHRLPFGRLFAVVEPQQ